MTSPPLVVVQLLAVFVKEVRQTAQDRRIVAMLTIAPFLQLLVFGFAVDFEIDRVPTVVVDLDASAESRQLVGALLADASLAQVGVATSAAEADEWLDDSEAAVALIVPEGFSRDLARGDPAQIQVLLDGTDPTRSGVAAGATARYLGEQGLARAEQRLAALGRSLPRVEVRPRLLYNPTMSTPVYMIPGLAGMLLLIITTVITGMGLAREREVGTLEQVRVTPLPSSVVMLGKIAPFVIVGLIDVTAAIAAGAWVFDVPVRGHLFTFYLFTALFLFTTVGMGLFLSTIAKTQQQAFIAAFMFMLPALLLSGTLTPIHAMPVWLQPITLINPLRFYLEAVRAILLKGAGLADLGEQALALTIYGGAILALASTRFRKRLV